MERNLSFEARKIVVVDLKLTTLLRAETTPNSAIRLVVLAKHHRCEIWALKFWVMTFSKKEKKFRRDK